MESPARAAWTQYWILLQVFSVLVGQTVVAITDPVETQSLLAFKASLDDPDGNLGNWMPSTDPCNGPWAGIFCEVDDYPSGLTGSNYSHVTELRLLNLNLGGQLVEELGNLQALAYLDVMWNRMNGSIPSSIGNLSNLELLLLNGNQFTGVLPLELGNLTNMNRIQIDQNHISGSVPSTFVKLTKIKHLHMNNNSLNGTIPVGLGGLPALLHVLLDSNQLTGTLPEDLANAPNLLIIQLDNNQFDSSASIPPAYGTIPTLLKLSLRNCSLQGEIPDFSKSTSLAVLDVSYNNLNSSIPTSNLSSNMTSIDLSYNELDGSIPESIGYLPQLQNLELRNNLLSGDIPATLGKEPSFSGNFSGKIILDFQNNSLSLNTSSDLVKLQSQEHVQVWLAGNPLVCSGEAASYNPLCIPTTLARFVGENPPDLPPADNNQCSICPLPFQIVPYTKTCACAAPITVIYRLKSPGFTIFDLYEEQFRIYLSEGLDLAEDQVQVESYEYEPGPRIRMELWLFPAAGTGEFNDTELSRIYNVFAQWAIPDSALFGPYELLQYIPPGISAGGGGSKGLSSGAIAGIVIGSVVLTAIWAAAMMFFVLRKRGWDPKASKITKRLLARSLLNKNLKVPGVRTFTFEELVRATDNFDEKNLLGQGGYGKVYFGTLEDGQKVAVKRAEEGSLQGTNEFETEIQLLSRVHHRNLVSLLGFCNDQGEHLDGEQMLVYEFIANGTLRHHLNKSTTYPMDIITRLRIALGSARGVHYLHTQADPPIFHRDIKASNILLDEKYNAKVSDFGLSKLAPTEVDFEGANAGHVSTLVKGTPGYLDPEYFLTHQLTDKSDVYSFGVVLLELISGMPPIHQGKNIVREIQTACSAGEIRQIVDPSMGSYPIETVEPFVKLGLACCHNETESRPSMAEVLHELEEIWKEAPWSDVGSHSHLGDMRDSLDIPLRMFSGSRTDLLYESRSNASLGDSGLISRTNMNVLPR